MEMHEYLDTLTGQIRNRRAKQAVREEIRAHIEDQARAFADGGMERDEALAEAVRQMGDPVEVGIDMDRIHRPKNNWKILVMIAILSAVGLAVQYFCIYRFEAESVLFYRQCGYTLTGLAVMAALYFCDYSLLGRYGRAAGFLFIASIAFVCLTGIAPVVAGAHGYMKIFMYFFIPVYGGILYEYKGKGGAGYACALLWLAAAAWLAVFVIEGGVSITLDVLFVCGFMLAVSLARNWYRVRRRRIAAAATGALLFFTASGIAMNLNDYQLRRIEVLLNPWFSADTDGYQAVVAREIVGGLRLVGGGAPEGAPVMRLPGAQYNYAMLQTASVWGVLAAGALIALLALFLASLLVMVNRQKNQLGQVIGWGCVLILALETFWYLMYNMGWGLMSTAGVPFFTFGRAHAVTVYGLLGILLSIYRYQDLCWEQKNGKKSRQGGLTAVLGKYRIRIERTDRKEIPPA